MIDKLGEGYRVAWHHLWLEMQEREYGEAVRTLMALLEDKYLPTEEAGTHD